MEGAGSVLERAVHRIGHQTIGEIGEMQCPLAAGRLVEPQRHTGNSTSSALHVKLNQIGALTHYWSDDRRSAVRKPFAFAAERLAQPLHLCGPRSHFPVKV